jgi:rhodanese-related sulfurtransferase
MNRFLKSNSPWLGLLGLALLVIVLAFIFRPKPPEYRINANQALKLMSDATLVVQVKDIGGKQLVDIRSAELFAAGHAANAVNIPARQLLEKESVEFFSQLQKEGKAALLYGSSELQATAPWLLLQQLGFSNVLRLKGGIGMENQLSDTELVSTEKQLLDTAVFSAKPGVPPVSAATGVKKPEGVRPVKREARTGGGC